MSDLLFDQIERFIRSPAVRQSPGSVTIFLKQLDEIANKPPTPRDREHAMELAKKLKTASEAPSFLGSTAVSEFGPLPS